jgi:hypothetical protein
VISEPGFAYGAAVSWCLESNADLDLAAALSAHVFRDPSGGLADAVLALGDAHRLVTPQFPNMSTLVMNLYYPQLPVGRGLTKGLTAEELPAVERCLEEARSAVDGSSPDVGDPQRLRDEVVFGIDLVSLLLRDARARLDVDGFLESVPPHVRASLSADLDALTERYRALWLVNNRPGGLKDSVRWLANLQLAYSTGRTDPDWGGIRVQARR